MSVSLRERADFGVGFLRAAMRSWMAVIASSRDELYGIWQWVGKNSTVSEIRSTRVAVTLILWQRKCSSAGPK